MLTVDFADVLCQIPAIGIPCAVLLDGKRTSSYRLRRIPGDIPESGMMDAGEVDAGNLQIVAVDIALMKCDNAVDDYFLVRASAIGIIGIFYDHVVFAVRERYGAILCVVHGRPNTGFRFEESLIAIGVELRDECGSSVLGDGGVLVEIVSIIHRDVVVLYGGLPVANVVVGVFVVCVLYLCFHQLIWQQLCAICTLSSITTSAKLPTWSW